MASINMSKVVTGGLLAGLIINVSEFVLNAGVLAKDWQQTMTSLNRPPDFTTAQIVGFNVFGFLIGIFAVWLYAAIRPRYGAGRNTAICAALATWFTVYLLGMAPPAMTGLFPLGLVAISVVWGLAEVLIATIVGARLYREE